jgi:Ca2+-binding RTX toxin-like protein
MVTVVTVTGGGAGYAPISLHFDHTGQALQIAQSLAAEIDSTFTTATYDRPNNPVNGSSNGGLLIAKGGALKSGTIDAFGFQAIVLQNNSHKAATVSGGVYDGNSQIVLGGNGGLDYTGLTGNDTVVVGGGDNTITFGDGNDEYYSAGSRVDYSGIIGGSGSATINAGAGHVLFVGSDETHVHGFNLTFIGGTASSTVMGGVGSYSITGGAGGGNFTGGSSGHNFIEAGAGQTTIHGGGADDTLIGGSGHTLIEAGKGNETLIGGSGVTVFDIGAGLNGAGTTDTIMDFNASKDVFHLGNGASDAFALNHVEVTGGNTFVTLDDGSKIELVGFTGKLGSANFH